jgi:hypothetical protein
MFRVPAVPRRQWAVGALVAVVTAGSACNAFLGIDDRPARVDAAGSSASAGGVGTATSSSSVGGSSNTGGAGGAALASNGTPCGTDGACASGFCAHGVCCDSACDAPCSQCALPGTEGSCTPLAELAQPQGCVGACDGAGTCATGNHLWSQQFFATGSVSVRDSAVDSVGNLVVGGEVSGSIDFGGGVTHTPAALWDGFVAKYADDGSLIWGTPITSTNEGRVRGVAVLPNDDVVAVGIFVGQIDVGFGDVPAGGSVMLDAFVVVLDQATGAITNGRIYGGDHDDRFRDVEVDSAGNVVIGGYFRSTTLDVSGGVAPTPLSNDGTNLRDPLLFGLASTLAYQWQYSPTVQDDARLWRLAIDSQDGIVAVGQLGTNANLDWGGGALPDGFVSDSAYVASLDKDRTHRWSRSITGGGDDFIEDVAIGPSDDVWVAGTVTGGADFGGGLSGGGGGDDAFFAHYDAAGQFLSAMRHGDTAKQTGSGVAVDPAGNVIVAAHFYGTLDIDGLQLPTLGSADLFFSKISPSGTRLWSRSYGGTGLDTILALAVGPTGIFAGGRFREALNFGGGLTTAIATPDSDGYIVKLAP